MSSEERRYSSWAEICFLICIKTIESDTKYSALTTPGYTTQITSAKMGTMKYFTLFFLIRKVLISHQCEIARFGIKSTPTKESYPNPQMQLPFSLLKNRGPVYFWYILQHNAICILISWKWVFIVPNVYTNSLICEVLYLPNISLSR